MRFVPRPRTKAVALVLQKRRSMQIGRAAVFGLRLLGEIRPQFGHFQQNSLLVRQRIARHAPAFFSKFSIRFRFAHYAQLRLAIDVCKLVYADTIPGHQ